MMATIDWSIGDAELLTMKAIEIGAKLAPEGPNSNATYIMYDPREARIHATREADLILNATEAP